jgi:ribonucleoside-diphosphate reductase alpha chain
VWEARYRFFRDGEPVDQTIHDTWRRVADAIASGEREPKRWASAYYGLLDDFAFLPGGRILAGAGTGRRVTLCNCFVMGTINDAMEPIFTALKEGALTMQAGGGVGYDFSTLRPAGTPARESGNIASGPVSFMRIWDAMCATICSTGARRGAMMATLRCDHPDIQTFVDAKRDPEALTHFNCSVLVTDAFMDAVRHDAEWPLVFPAHHLPPQGTDTIRREWPGEDGAVSCAVIRRLPARELWDQIMRATYDCSEPGVLFIDRINHENNLSYCERLSATNPCGEVPLPDYGACDLGSFNLTSFVRNPFETDAAFDFDALRRRVPLAVRFLDSVIDVSGYPLSQQADQARASRRIGLGVTGLGDALIMLGLHYGSDPARTLAAEIMKSIRHEAYAASVALAREKGAFPLFQADAYLSSPGIRRLPDPLRREIAQDGLRNSHLTAIAPTGTISLLANNISSGMEPVFAAEYQREVRGADGISATRTVRDYACQLWRETGAGEPLPPAFASAETLQPADHLAMQATLQPHVDHAISKTVNVPSDLSFADFREIYAEAHRLGLKGCTTYRPGGSRAAVLTRPA